MKPLQIYILKRKVGESCLQKIIFMLLFSARSQFVNWNTDSLVGN